MLLVLMGQCLLSLQHDVYLQSLFFNKRLRSSKGRLQHAYVEVVLHLVIFLD